MAFIDLKDYNPGARAYWWTTVSLGAACFIFSASGLLNLGFAALLGVGAFMAAVFLAGLRPISIPGTHASITPGDVFLFMSALFWGAPAAMIVAVTDALTASILTTGRWASRLMSAAIMAISVFISASLFSWALEAMLGAGLSGITSMLTALLLFSILHFALNSLLTATHYSLKRRANLFTIWWTNYSWASLTYVASASAAGLIYMALSRYGAASLIAAGPLVAIVFATCHFYFKQADERAKSSEQLSRVHLATVEALATAIDAKDQITHDHVYRVQVYATGVARHFGLGDLDIEALKAGALLHDVGKIAVPDYILNKPGKLTAAEFEKMKVHTIVGAQIMERVNFPFPVVPIVRHHHERWDGRGYPDGLRGEQIPLTARILTVVDCFDAVSEDRQYRRGMTRDQACQFLRDNAGKQFDPAVVDAFIENLPKYEAEIAAHKAQQQPLLTPTTQAGLSESALSAVPAAGLAQSSEPLDYIKQIHAAHAEVAALYEMSQTFSASLDVRDVVTLTVNRIEGMIPFTTCVVYMRQQGNDSAHATYAFGPNAERIRGRSLAAGHGIAGWVIINCRPMSNTDPMLDLADFLGPGEVSYRTAAVYPLTSGEEAVGALALYSTELEAYSSDHLRLLESVARFASTALQHAILYEQTKNSAQTDALTGLPNGRALYARLDQKLAEAREQDEPMTVLSLNISGMRAINDTFGYQAGDRLLAAVSGRLRQVIGDSYFLGRVAGDEFICLMTGRGRSEAVEVGCRAQFDIEAFNIEIRPGQTVTAGLSFGAAGYPADGQTIDELLQAAALATRQNKSARKLAVGMPLDPPYTQADEQPVAQAIIAS